MQEIKRLYLYAHPYPTPGTPGNTMLMPSYQTDPNAPLTYDQALIEIPDLNSDEAAAIIVPTNTSSQSAELRLAATVMRRSKRSNVMVTKMDELKLFNSFNFGPRPAQNPIEEALNNNGFALPSDPNNLQVTVIGAYEQLSVMNIARIAASILETPVTIDRAATLYSSTSKTTLDLAIQRSASIGPGFPVTAEPNRTPANSRFLTMRRVKRQP